MVGKVHASNHPSTSCKKTLLSPVRMKTDAQGDIQWQNLYSGTEPTGFNSIALNDIIQTTDGGYAAAGSSCVGSLTYGTAMRSLGFFYSLPI